jgi:hypothetical protein
MDWSPGKEEPNVRDFTTKSYVTRVIQRDRLASCLQEEIRERCVQRRALL